MRPVVAIDPGRVSGIACVSPSPSRGRPVFLLTQNVRVEPGVAGLLAIQDALAQILARGVTANGWQVSDVDWVVEDQHMQFASAAIIVTEIRRTWEVYVYEIAQVLPERMHPSEWRMPYGLNRKIHTDKKLAARAVLDALLAETPPVVLEMAAAPRGRRTSDEVDAALMALSRAGILPKRSGLAQCPPA